MKNKCFYNTRVWLNKNSSRNTGSIVCYDGITEFSDGMNEDSFVEIADCHNKVRIHKDLNGTNDEWLNKLRLLRDNLNNFILFLESK